MKTITMAPEPVKKQRVVGCLWEAETQKQAASWGLLTYPVTDELQDQGVSENKVEAPAEQHPKLVSS